MKTSKLGMLVLTTILIAGCGISFQSQNTDNQTSVHKGIEKVPASAIKLSREDIARLDKEYLSFKTKSLSAEYFQKKLVMLIGNDNGVVNGSLIVQDLEYARYKTETVIPFQAMTTANPPFYTTLKGITAVINQRSLSAPFDAFISGAPAPNSGAVTTLAGSGTSGSADGTGTNASFNLPYGVAVDSLGNVYVSDLNNNKIRKITSSGVVSTLAGTGASAYTDGNGTSAQFNSPYGIAVDSAGNVYVGDNGNHKIRKIDNTTNHVVTTLAGSTAGFADGNGTSAQFNYPKGVTVDSSGNVYVVDSVNSKIRKITSGGVVTTLAGGVSGYVDAIGTNAQFNNPFGIAVDSSGNVYVSEQGNQRIRKITSAGVVTTLAGNGSVGYVDGPGTSAQFSNPYGVAVDSLGNVYVADLNNNKIRKITSSGVVTTVAGSTQGSTDGTGTNAQFNGPAGVAVDASGTFYVADYYNNKIRKIQ